MLHKPERQTFVTNTNKKEKGRCYNLDPPFELSVSAKFNRVKCGSNNFSH